MRVEITVSGTTAVWGDDRVTSVSSTVMAKSEEGANYSSGAQTYSWYHKAESRLMSIDDFFASTLPHLDAAFADAKTDALVVVDTSVDRSGGGIRWARVIDSPRENLMDVWRVSSAVADALRSVIFDIGTKMDSEKFAGK